MSSSIATERPVCVDPACVVCGLLEARGAELVRLARADLANDPEPTYRWRVTGPVPPLPRLPLVRHDRPAP